MGKALWCRAIRTLIFPLRFCRYHRTRCKQAGQRVVILVDEYDKPMLQAIGNEKIAKQIPGHFKPFYGALKTMDGYYKVCVLDRRYKVWQSQCV